jgi:hypothetical protein
MAFDPNAFAAGQSAASNEQPRRRKPGEFDPTTFIGDLAAAPQPPVRGEPTPEKIAQTGLMGTGSAALTAYGMSGPAITGRMAYDTLGRPILESSGRVFQDYVANPFRAGRDIAASKVAPGIIPAQVARGALPEIGQQLAGLVGQLPKGTDINASSFLNGLQPQDQARFVKEVNEKGLEQAFKSFSPPSYLDETGRAGLAAVQQSFPSGMTKLARGAGLLGRTAARFAGPAGLAMTAYDLYEMGKYAYDKYQQNKQMAPNQDPAVAMTFPEAQAAASYVDVKQSLRDEDLRQEAARRAMRGPQ